MLMADSEFCSSLINPNSIETLDDCSSPSSPKSDVSSNETLIVASPISLEEEEEEFLNNLIVTPESQVLPVTDMCTSDDPCEIFPSPCYDTDDDTNEEEPVKKENIFTFMSSGVGRGLANLGNSCFLNSVLQCLTHTVPFVKSLRSYKTRGPCNCGKSFCVMWNIRNHMKLALRNFLSYSIPPLYFLNNLNFFSPDFLPGQQEDAQEFLSEFLDKLERCCVDRYNPKDNIVENVFGGRLLSMLRCCNCGFHSKMFEPSVGMSLEIEEVNNLWQALDSFTRVEELDEQLSCDECNQKVAKRKQISIDKLPLVAMFHLKRFKNNGFFMEKIYNRVNFPLELDLEPYMKHNENEVSEVTTTYHLYAFVEHLGSLSNGHYTSYVRSAPKTWHKFDDDKVFRIDEASVLAKDAYILFYVKKGTPWFSKAYQEMQPLLAARFSPQSVSDPSNGECVSNKAEDKSKDTETDQGEDLETKPLHRAREFVQASCKNVSSPQKSKTA